MDSKPNEHSTGGVSVPRQPPSAQTGPDIQAVSAGGDSGTMSQDTEVDMKEVELNELEPEKQPMNAAAGAAAGEKNGLVKIKVAEDEAEAEAGAKFTGLSKEELLKVAGSPGWVRTRWALLLLFWLGWLGMLAGAVVIIVRAPRCRELPVQRWWHEGALYRVGDLQAFVGPNAGGIAGLKKHLEYLSTLKVKGLVLGPIHKNQKDDVNGTDLKQIDPSLGSQEDFKDLLQSAKKKKLSQLVVSGIHIILDLTPNYRGQSAWFLPAQADWVATKMKEALSSWLQEGVDGFQFRDVEKLMVSQAGLLTASVPAQLLRLYQLMLFTLPGTPVFSYGDEIGLQEAVVPGQPVEAPFMPWDESSLPQTPGHISTNMTVKGQNEDPGSLLTQFRWLSDLRGKERGKERSLLHGDFRALTSSPGIFSYVRYWDQNERYLVVLNFQDVGLSARLEAANLPAGISLPASANLLFSTNSTRLGQEQGTSLSLENLYLNPHEGLLLHFPYVA
ncbi:solute carrier family 3 (activators of dibasic and neutral amino acid transport) member 2 [Cricetulus griseus]